jgi:hypothetical protein
MEKVDAVRGKSADVRGGIQEPLLMAGECEPSEIIAHGCQNLQVI